ncbi:Crp/Fnr family transcriptional regulator [Nonomuraea sp. NPDC046802]|uniref:Crp/Fnr family transcriptional regulator n=1 Tax=Nonomuraea sp. NPDC046802 TaxID=3154919 RepID=UPI0033FB78E5
MHSSRTPEWPARTLMAGLDQSAGRELRALGTPVRLPAGKVLIRQGDEDDRRVFLLCSAGAHTALVKVTAGLANGAESLLGIRVSGDVVGEMAALCHEPRSATVTLCSDAVVHEIPGRAFQAFLERRPAASLAVTAMVADRLNWANRRRVDMAGYDVATHLRAVLAEMVERHGRPTAEGYDLGVSLTQAELGRLIGARQDAIGKAMRCLSRSGLVKTTYKRVIVPNPDQLRLQPTND